MNSNSRGQGTGDAVGGVGTDGRCCCLDTAGNYAPVNHRLPSTCLKVAPLVGKQVMALQVGGQARGVDAL